DGAAGAGVMSRFTPEELAYLRGERRLARIATVGRDGTPHVVPVGWAYNADLDTVDVSGHDFAATKKYRDVARSGRAAIVIDDVLAPWQPRARGCQGASTSSMTMAARPLRATSRYFLVAAKSCPLTSTVSRSALYAQPTGTTWGVPSRPTVAMRASRRSPRR